METGKVDELMSVLGLAREDAKRMALVRRRQAARRAHTAEPHWEP